MYSPARTFKLLLDNTTLRGDWHVVETAPQLEYSVQRYVCVRGGPLEWLETNEEMQFVQHEMENDPMLTGSVFRSKMTGAPIIECTVEQHLYFKLKYRGHQVEIFS